MRQLKITSSITSRNVESLDKYLNDVSKEGMITAEEEAELASRVKKGDALALDKLVRANLRFVISVAKQYQHQGLGLTDLISEGNIGLIKAAKRFDETRGFKFISYSVWWIRSTIMQAIMDNSKLIRLPQSKLDLLNKVNRAKKLLSQEYSREPSISELADYLEVSKEKIAGILEASNGSVSLDATFGDDSESTLLDVMSSDSLPATDASLNTESLRKDIDMVLRVLNERERKVLKDFFGFDGHATSLDEIADKFGISVERVRQIKDRAIYRLRNSKGFGVLQKYLA
ncbi:MAG: RNA polymerase sigma factor RpoD/SigA [Bacteroidales bacterium]|nr:RNA polymerase sigma factor RpoD/SigA [Bacteroidales bacterium]